VLCGSVINNVTFYSHISVVLLARSFTCNFKKFASILKKLLIKGVAIKKLLIKGHDICFAYEIALQLFHKQDLQTKQQDLFVV